MNSVQNWGDVFMNSASAAIAIFMAAIPKVIAFALILIVGWFLASLLGKIVNTLLHAVRFDHLAQRAGFSDFISKMGIRSDASGFVASVAKWFVRLIALVVAFDALGLPAVSAVLEQLLLWLPNVVVALFVMVIAGLAATALSNIVRGATAKSGLGDPELLAKIASTAVWVFAVIIAVNQLGVGVAIVNTLFMATVGALALALGLSFGLGARDTAGKIVAKWYRAAQDASPRISAAATGTTTAASAGTATVSSEGQIVERRKQPSLAYTGPERRMA